MIMIMIWWSWLLGSWNCHNHDNYDDDNHDNYDDHNHDYNDDDNHDYYDDDNHDDYDDDNHECENPAAAAAEKLWIREYGAEGGGSS